MAAQVIYLHRLKDEELRVHLEKKDTIVFQGLGRE